MKTFKIISLLLLVASMNGSCTGKTTTGETSPVQDTDDVHVYYFHNARRCATCKAVEAESKKAVEELYGDTVSFASYNLEEADGEQKADELGVSGQTLLIVSGDAQFNITNEGFMNARTNPDKLKQLIRDTIDPLM